MVCACPQTPIAMLPLPAGQGLRLHGKRSLLKEKGPDLQQRCSVVEWSLLAHQPLTHIHPVREISSFSLYHCGIFFPLLCVSSYSPPDFWLFLPDSTHIHPPNSAFQCILPQPPILHISSKYFCSISVTHQHIPLWLHFPPQLPKNHFHPPSLLSSVLSAHLHPQLPTALPTSHVPFPAHLQPSHPQTL